MIIKGKKKLNGEINIPGDKSISHRAIILGALAEGETNIENILLSEDTLNTIECFKQMGIEIEVDNIRNRVKVLGKGLHGLKQPRGALYCGNSGTTMRLLSGLLVGQSFPTTLMGDESLSDRPMDRIIIPLSKMGANINGEESNYPPLNIQPVSRLQGMDYHLPVASAQVKSAILLASLYSEDETKVMGTKVTRDHTERMMEYFKVDNFNGRKIYVPGDISSAAFFIVGATIIQGSNLVLKNVGINPTRTGILDVLKDMGGNIQIENIRNVNNEPMADIHVSHAPLKGIKLDGNIIGRLIDEIPIIAVAAAFANGTTIIRNAEELRYKETDRIKAMVDELKNMGANIEDLPDGLIIKGKEDLRPGNVESYNDHRIAMALSIAALNIDGNSEIKNSKCVNISYPSFYDMI